jgi:thiol-disulfide isomerase/thioredoxin
VRGARPIAGLVVLTVVAVLSGCSSDAGTVAEQAMAGDGKGYVAGDGAVEQLAAAQRGGPVALSGTTVDGKPWSMAGDAAGKVVVVNVWGSWCGPCVDEMPHLQQAWSSYLKAGKPVAFVGIDIKESSATAAAFLKANTVTYPSLSDGDSGGRPMLALQGKAAATPTTLVLDRQGRIAARVLGATTGGTLTALVDDVVAEQS